MKKNKIISAPNKAGKTTLIKTIPHQYHIYTTIDVAFIQMLTYVHINIFILI